MHKMMMICAALALSGCGEISGAFDDINQKTAAIEACKDFTVSLLASPSSYREVSVSQWDESLTGDEMKGIVEMWPEIGTRTPGMRMIGIEYDAENEAGGMERSSNVCPFPTANGEILDSEVKGLKSVAENIRALINQEQTGEDFPKMKAPVA